MTGAPFATAYKWALRLYDVGLIVLPRWGGGNALPGTNHQHLADNPPSREAVMSANYGGGMAILLGTKHPAGGYTLGLDIDKCPAEFSPPSGCLYSEEGTGPSKYHVFHLSTDRLEGQINLRDQGGAIVAEIKGYGHVLRCYPTLPPDKPRGYRPIFLVEAGAIRPPTLTARQIAEALADYLSQALGERMSPEAPHAKALPLPVGPGLANRIIGELERRGVELKQAGRDGWLQGRCPFHNDRRPSFAVSFQVGGWRCHAGCGSGGLRSLAWRLGIRLHQAHRPRPALGWEVSL